MSDEPDRPASHNKPRGRAFTFARPPRPAQSYRAMCHGDIGGMIAIDRASAALDNDDDEPWSQEDFIAELSDAKSGGLVAIDPDWTVTAYILTRSKGKARDVVQITRMMVRPDCRRQGIASNLIRLARCNYTVDSGESDARPEFHFTFGESLTTLALCLKKSGGTAKLVRRPPAFEDLYSFRWPPMTRQL